MLLTHLRRYLVVIVQSIALVSGRPEDTTYQDSTETIYSTSLLAASATQPYTNTSIFITTDSKYYMERARTWPKARALDHRDGYSGGTP